MTEPVPTMRLQVDSVGLVEMFGVAPWRVHEISRHSFDIIDSTGRTVNPSITGPAKGGRGTKRNQNVVFAGKSVPNVIVTACNAEHAKAPK